MTITEPSGASSGMTIDPNVTDGLLALRANLDGELFLADDPGWDAARRAWQLLADQHPVAVVSAASAADVVATVRSAAALDLRVAPQGTGHSAGAVPALDRTILLRTNRLRGVVVDAVGMTARAEAGAEWADVMSALAPHGLAAVAGMSPDVGVVGYTLGGGLGWLGRSHGLAANSLLAVDAVDASGAMIRIDSSHHEDLFWALRGGVAPVIVTAVEFRLYAIPQVYAGALMWPIDRAADVAHAWREWVAEVPASVTSLARVLRYPPIPELPPFLQGRAFVAVEVAMQESVPDAEALLEPLRRLEPEFDFARPMPTTELGSVHGDPQQPSPAYGTSTMLASISRECIDAFLDCALSEAAASLLSIELRHLGGELEPERGEGGALDSLDGQGIVFAVGIVPVPEALAVVESAADAVIDGLSAHSSPRTFRNFRERAGDPATLYGDALERLRRIDEEWDPRGLVSLAHPVR
jgi:hypothetical protein